ncbi:cyclin-A1 [Rhinophrynus dorsalis]
MACNWRGVDPMKNIRAELRRDKQGIRGMEPRMRSLGFRNFEKDGSKKPDQYPFESDDRYRRRIRTRFKLPGEGISLIIFRITVGTESHRTRVPVCMRDAAVIVLPARLLCKFSKLSYNLESFFQLQTVWVLRMHRSVSSSGHFTTSTSTMGTCNGYQNHPSLPKMETLVQSNFLPQRTQRTVLGVISDNEQCRRSHAQDAAPAKSLPGFENLFPTRGKIHSTNTVPVAPKPCFTIYVDEPQEAHEEKCSLDVEYPSLEEADVNMVKQNFHLLLDISAASPMMVDTSFQTHAEEGFETDPDAIAVSEYIEEIHQYLREAEIKNRPKAYYMRKQPDITAAMRTILIDWLIEVGEEYKLRSETLYLAVNYLDRFLSCMSVLRGKLQLVGTAAILLASKYEEIYPPDVDEFVYITDDTYSKKQLLRMEHLMLKVLAFDMTVPTINQFLLQYLHRHAVSVKTEHFAMYLAELSLLNVEPFLKYVPSLMAAAAYSLANYTVNNLFWPDDLVSFTGYTLSDIEPCLSDLHRACLNAPHQEQQAIREKYKAPKYMQVSLLEPPALLPLH